MHIAKGISMLTISAAMMGRTEVIHPALIWDEHTTILVDTGYPGQLPLIREEMEKLGISFNKLNKVILSHQDLDHIGSLPIIAAELAPAVEVFASKLEQPYIQGDAMLLKITPDSIAQAMEAIPAEVPDEWRRAFRQLLENPPKAKVDTLLTDGEELPYCGGLTVIATPGHTPGHISLYHQQSKTLIAADAMIVVDGQLLGPDPQQSLDYAQAKRSLSKFVPFDIAAVICYHGGIYTADVNQRIAELAAAE
ncbi:putative metallo-hydrolase YflN [Paenibacillus plantiphilus]|uniref:Metallo-hydrolase YflN n=1 Tax=Paenibacillus plantiphilus TaxID=2905650 RepID=A0ABM9CIC1_9BACL|nr:MBL fold metallo-hydrolase [Paenibacillus plantiphilus]CAH1215179.1 putative metallo-hydrolase YflN [Paenibacillus plantiphilus]